MTQYIYSAMSFMKLCAHSKVLNVLMFF